MESVRKIALKLIEIIILLTAYLHIFRTSHEIFTHILIKANKGIIADINGIKICNDLINCISVVHLLRNLKNFKHILQQLSKPVGQFIAKEIKIKFALIICIVFVQSIPNTLINAVTIIVIWDFPYNLILIVVPRIIANIVAEMHFVLIFTISCVLLSRITKNQRHIETINEFDFDCLRKRIMEFEKITSNVKQLENAINKYLPIIFLFEIFRIVMVSRNSSGCANVDVFDCFFYMSILFTNGLGFCKMMFLTSTIMKINKKVNIKYPKTKSSKSHDFRFPDSL